ncbi:hypothetical protein OsJ_30867 [Oryza sativa Japonica Group]|uniref:Uncharacterized protein n=1 Tax=Oryza sativa subsp. japonica TaxID=39947 RepID=B9G7R1_ORYSJ|nr:hypothetical protein OsJ_30867 [Oryza sativa Japonica Group]
MACPVMEACLDGLVGDGAADPGGWVSDVGVASPLDEVASLGEWATVRAKDVRAVPGEEEATKPSKQPDWLPEEGRQGPPDAVDVHQWDQASLASSFSTTMLPLPATNEWAASSNGGADGRWILPGRWNHGVSFMRTVGEARRSKKGGKVQRHGCQGRDAMGTMGRNVAGMDIACRVVTAAADAGEGVRGSVTTGVGARAVVAVPKLSAGGEGAKRRSLRTVKSASRAASEAHVAAF